MSPDRARRAEPSAPLPVPRPGPGVAALHAACRRAGYTEAALRERLHGADGPIRNAAVKRLYLAQADPLATLARLLLLGDPVARAHAEPVLAPATVDELIATGWLLREGEAVTSPWRVEPHGDLLVASDRAEAAHPPPDVVAGINPVGVATAMLTPRRPVRSLLDLGTGCGIQALLAAGHSERVLGVDVNPRALALAAANAQLNGLTNVGWAHGSWLEPVAGRRFDLIVCNPPYVISPDSEYLYRDSGLPPAALARRLLADIPGHLDEGGLAQVMLNWPHRAAGPWDEPVRGWLRGSGCDALVLRLAEDDPVAYAAKWNLPRLRRGTAAFDEAVERWTGYLRAQGIEAISWGAVVMRRRSAPRAHWVAPLDVGSVPSAAAGDHVLRLFDAHDRLAEHDGEAWLLDERPRLVGGHRIDQTLTRDGDRYRSHPAVVRASPGLELRTAIDPDALPALFRCDGRHTLRDVCGEDAGRRAVACAAARELVAAGLLTLS